HQDPDGGSTACGAWGAASFVCRDFHTADLAWTAQVLDELPNPGVAQPAPWPIQSGDCNFAEAGVLRLESPHTVALVRTTKLPRNTQFGGAAGGGALCYAGHAPGWANVLTIDRERALVEGSFVLYPARPNRLGALRRFL